MRVAVVGSRNVLINDLEMYLPLDTTEIITGGAKGVDNCAAEYALANGIKVAVFCPEYEKYGRAAPLKRNAQIVENADMVLAFWDEKSRGTKNVINICLERKVTIEVYIVNKSI